MPWSSTTLPASHHTELWVTGSTRCEVHVPVMFVVSSVPADWANATTCERSSADAERCWARSRPVSCTMGSTRQPSMPPASLRADQ